VADLDSPNVPLSELEPEEKAKRAGSFGGVASQYERYRPGPPVDAVEWIVPARVRRVVDLGAGTGALTRLLVDRADEVVAVEPDDRMRAVLTERNPGVRAIHGYGESMPLPDGCADAVVASSSWHWMDPAATLPEVRRVLVPGGILAVLWSGPDPEGPFLVQAQSILAQQSTTGDGDPRVPVAGEDPEADGDMAQLIMGDANRPTSSLEIPPDAPFTQPEHEVFRWDVALNADDLIGLLGTMSWFILMDERTRLRVFAEARRLMKEYLGVEGDVTVDVAFRADAWKSHRKP
jgi:SAM-dependent methyltransferase